jgi:hypothetical protein
MSILLIGETTAQLDRQAKIAERRERWRRLLDEVREERRSAATALRSSRHLAERARGDLADRAALLAPDDEAGARRLSDDYAAAANVQRRALTESELSELTGEARLIAGSLEQLRASMRRYTGASVRRRTGPAPATSR